MEGIGLYKLVLCIAKVHPAKITAAFPTNNVILTIEFGISAQSYPKSLKQDQNKFPSEKAPFISQIQFTLFVFTSLIV
jgi:hypothetical protein